MSEAVEGEIVNQPKGVRLTKHDEQIVQLLEAAFNNGFNITEACQYAEISRETYYEWLRDDDIFSYRMSVAQSAPHRKAKQNVIQAIAEGDPNISIRFLTLRDPDFKPRSEIDVGGKPQETTEEKLKEFLDDKTDGAYDEQRAKPAAAPKPASRGKVAEAPTDIS